MANYREDILDIDLKGGNINRGWLNHTIGAGDEKANRFGVRVFRDKQPVILTGTCIGLFRRADNETVPIRNGVISGNVAYVTLPKECYVVEGVFSLAIKVTATDNTITLRIVDGMVDNTGTEVYVDPGTILPDIEDLINSINAAMEDIPLDYSALSNGFRDSMLEAFGTSAPGTWVSYTIKRLDGTLETSSVYKTTGFIPVTGGEVLFTTSPAVNATVLDERATIAFYSTNDASGYISSEPFTQGTPATLVWSSVKVPTGAKYLRITIEGTLTDQFKCIQVFSISSLSYMNQGVLANNSDLNNIKFNSVFQLSDISTYSNAPFTGAQTLITNRFFGDDYVSQFVVKFLTGRVAYRHCGSGSWSDWNYNMDYLHYYVNHGAITANSDLNDQKENGTYQIYGNREITNHPYPNEAGYVIVNSMDGGMNYVSQLFIGWISGKSAYRYCNNGTWQPWVYITNNTYINHGLITNNTDLDDFRENGAYQITTGYSITNHPFPGEAATVFVNNLLGTTDTRFVNQIAYRWHDGRTAYRRCQNDVWGDWIYYEQKTVQQANKLFAFGDSTVWGYIAVSHTQSNNNYPALAGRLLGMTVSNNAVPGQGLIADWDTILSTINSLDMTGAKLIIVGWAYNDYSYYPYHNIGEYTDTFDNELPSDQTNSVVAYYYQIMKILQTKCPSAQVVLVTGYGAPTAENDRATCKQQFTQLWQYKDGYHNLGELYDKLESMCNLHGWHCINQHHGCGVNEFNANTVIGDNIHPTDAGYWQYSSPIAARIASVFTNIV